MAAVLVKWDETSARRRVAGWGARVVDVRRSGDMSVLVVRRDIRWKREECFERESYLIV